MNEVRRVLRLASWRLFALDLFRVLAITLTGALVLAILARLTERAFGLRVLFAPYWTPAGAGLGALAVLVALVWAFIVRRRAMGVARELDARAGLRESLSTALCVERETDPWSVAMVETASRTAAAVKVAQAIPLEVPKVWPVPLATAAAFVLIWFTVPNLDLLGVDGKRTAEVRKREEFLAVRTDLDARQQRIKELLEKAKVDLAAEGETSEGEDKKLEANDPDAIRRAAVKNLTDLTERLADIKEGEKAAQVEALKEAMRQLKTPGDGPLNEFSRSLARGDFNKAQAQLQEMQKALADGGMSPEEKARAKAQMENMAKQLDKLAADQQQVAKKLEGAGLDKKQAQELAKAAAADPEALKKALEKMAGMSDEQKQQLLEMAKSAMGAQGQAAKLGEAMAKMAKGMAGEGMQQEGMEGMEQLAGELSKMEMLESDMQNLDAALDEAKAQLAELGGQCMGGDKPGDGAGGKMGQWRMGDSSKQGNGSGGPGQGNGASPSGQAADFTMEKKKADTKTTAGPIIGSRLVFGEQVRGESVTQFAEAVEQGSAGAAEAIESKQVPREYQDAVKHYFGRLQEKVKKDQTAAGTPPVPSAPPAPKPPA